MHLNVTAYPSGTVFCAALVVSLAPSGLSTNLNQNLSLSLFYRSHISPGYKSQPLVKV